MEDSLPVPPSAPHLLDLLDKHFNAQELRDLCVALAIDYENLRGEVKRAKAYALMLRMQRRQRLPELVAACERERPGVPWASAAVAAPHDDDAFAGEYAFYVAGLRNPYLGLRAFTADDRAIFAGRERIVQTLIERLSADEGDRFLLIVGASGSGKSSLVQAGLLPALAERLQACGYVVQKPRIERPGKRLLQMLERLHQADQSAIAAQPAPYDLLLIDQFEELFTQRAADERTQTLTLLADLAKSANLPARIIATLRSDFLPHILADERFAASEKRKVVLRAMSETELADAIQRPIQVFHPENRIEPALVERLARDAAADAAHLPLLQVTLEDLWRGGKLHLAAYRGLSDAIQRRADAVYTYHDHDGLQQAPRTATEQQAILALFLDLVRVALNDQQHDLRWRRSRATLTHGDPQRERLIDDLASARLLRTDREPNPDDPHAHEIETVDIIHEALLSAWPTLKDAIDAQRAMLQRREYFKLALAEWRDKQRGDAYLLTGVRLAEAEALTQEGDRVLREVDAQAFYERSVQRRDDERQRQVRRARRVALGLSVLAVLALVAAGAAGVFGVQANRSAQEAQDNAATAVVERGRADSQAGTAVAERRRADMQVRVAQSQQLAFAAQSQVRDAPVTALLLAYEAASRDKNESSDAALRMALDQAMQGSISLKGHTSIVSSATFSPDGQRIVTASWDYTARVWGLDGTLLATLQGHTDAINSAVFSPDGQRIVTTSNDQTARVWGLDGTLLATLQGHTDSVTSAVFSPDGQHIVTASNDQTARVWGRDGTLLAMLQGHTDAVNSAVFSPDGQRIVTASDDHTARVWKLDGPSFVTLQGHTDTVWSAAFSPDGQRIVTASDDQTARVWGRDGTFLTTLKGHITGVRRAIFSPNGQRIATLSTSGGAWIWSADGVLLATLQRDIDMQSFERFSSSGNLMNINVIGGNNPQLSFIGDIEVYHTAFSPDGQRIITTDGTTHIHIATIDGLMSIAACRVGRGLTEEEITRFHVPTPLAFDFEHRHCPSPLENTPTVQQP